ncbi:MAG: Uma2 family endonuclease [Dehalococcoidia bacterium]|nr:Uma2 family endonuclease [Dehalococcoidia bacterium]MDW8120241.1 Uma2 family endonuclease [Chloroflexota bacterium]
MTSHTRLTAQDLWRMGAGDARRELVNGEVVEMPPAGGVHGSIVTRLASAMAQVARANKSGEVLSGDVGFILRLPYDPERVRAPDIAFLAAHRLPQGRLPEGFLDGPPDLAVEILSPSDNPIEIQQKVRDYLEAGTRLVWVVAPRAKTITVYRPDGSARLLREHDTLDGEDVLPGLRVPLSEVF